MKSNNTVMKRRTMNEGDDDLLEEMVIYSCGGVAAAGTGRQA